MSGGMENRTFNPEDYGAASLAAMSAAVDGLSASAPNGHLSSSVTNEDGRTFVLSPGGHSYGGAQVHSNTNRSRTLKQAKGTGRKISHQANRRSYNQLVEEVEKTPGAEIRIVQSNEGLIQTKADRIRLKYYDSCRRLHMAENRRRTSSILEGEEEPLMGGNSINQSEGFLEFPMHMLPPQVFQIHIPGQDGQSNATQSSFVTIASIWNTMMGTSLLAVPWAILASGLVMGFGIVIFMTIIAFYTAHIVIKNYAKHNNNPTPIAEFPQLCGKLLGKPWDTICSVFSIMAVQGAAVVYWVLMATFLESTVEFVIGEPSHPSSNSSSIIEVICPSNPSNDGMVIVDQTDINPYFNKKTAPLYLILLLPVISVKSPTFFTKFNSLGTLNVFFLIGVVMFLGGSWGLHVDFQDPTSFEYVALFKSSFPSLSGMMALGLFIHNAIITIMKNNRYQENNTRDLAAGFTLVSGTYLLIGATFFLTFPLSKECIEDNFLNNFHVDNHLIVAARILLLFQLLTVFPLIMFILRSSVFMLISKNEHASYKKIYMINLIFCAVCICFAIEVPSIGNIIRYSGALCGAVVLFVLPSLVFLADAKREGRLTVWNVSLHVFIMALGLINFGAQFFI